MRIDEIDNLNDEGQLALERFQAMHKDADSASRYRISGKEHGLTSGVSEGDEIPLVKCSCGATLVLDKEPYVQFRSVEPSDDRPVFSLFGTPEDIEAIYQSALVTLPDSTLDKIRKCLNTMNMHFGLGMYLRNHFIHSGKPGASGIPDDASGKVLDRLVAYTLPELRDYPLVYEALDTQPLALAVSACIAIYGALPVKACIRHYQILVDAERLDEQNPYDRDDDENFDERENWHNRVSDMKQIFVSKVIEDVRNEAATSMTCNGAAIEETLAFCRKLLNDPWTFYAPLEIAYFIDREKEVPPEAYHAIDWILDVELAREKILKDALKDSYPAAYIEAKQQNEPSQG